MVRFRKISSFLGFILINLFFLELFSFFILLFLGKAHWNYGDKLEKIPEIIFSEPSKSKQLPYIYYDLFSGGVPHPYFAFRYGGSSYGDKKYNGFDVDVHGFYGDVKFPFEKKSTDFVFGILGGSVADQFARYILGRQDTRERLINVLRKRYPESKNKKIKLVGLGQAGSKQPQQFFIASYLLKYLDVTINVDGYNEYAPAPIEYPIEFPAGEGYYSYLNGVDRENHGLHQKVQNILFLREISSMIRLDRYISFLKFSQSYFLFQTFFYTLFAQKILENIHAIQSRRDDNRKKMTYFTHLYRHKGMSLRVEVWKRFSLQQYHLSKAYGVQSLFFLQPIPDRSNVKIWSEEEKEKGFVTANSKKRRFCRLIRDEVQSLRRKKLPFYDLSYIFKDVKETVYVDKIHFNDRGHEILFKEILKIIKTQNQANVKNF